MRLLLAAVGRLKDGPERELFDRYWSRLATSGRAIGITAVSLKEIPESRAREADVRRSEEGRQLAEATRGLATIVLDERGKTMASDQFARHLSGVTSGGHAGIAVLIGGPDGHGADVLAGASLRLSIGPMTLPHGLVRVIVAEQLYRAATIVAGHPYHRG